MNSKLFTIVLVFLFFNINYVSSALFGFGGYTNIELAVLNGWMDKLKYYIEDEGADVNFSASKNCGALLHLACKCFRVEVIEYLLSKGADINISAWYGNPFLGMLRWIDHSNLEKVYEVTKLLIEKGVDISCVDEHGMTAFFHLYNAIQHQYRNLEWYEKKINKGIFNYKNKNKPYSEDYRVSAKKCENNISTVMKIIRLLLSYGALINKNHKIPSKKKSLESLAAYSAATMSEASKNLVNYSDEFILKIIKNLYDLAEIKS